MKISRNWFFVALVAIVGAIGTLLLLRQFGGSDADRPSRSPARLVSPLVDSPFHVVAACRNAQETTPITLLCPARLPRSEDGRTCLPPSPPYAGPLSLSDGKAGLSYDVGNATTVGLDFTDASEDAPTSLHFIVLIQEEHGDDGPKPSWDRLGRRTLGGVSGALFYAPRGVFHAGHLVFRFRRGDHGYAASLHIQGAGSWANQDVARLDALVSTLRPVHELDRPEPATVGWLGSRVGSSTGPSWPEAIAAADASAVVLDSFSISLNRDGYRLVLLSPSGSRRNFAPLPSVTNNVEVRHGRAWIGSAEHKAIYEVPLQSQGGDATRIALPAYAENFALAGRSLWALHSGSGGSRLSRIDVRSREVDESVRVNGRPTIFDAARGRIWGADCRKESVRIWDAHTGRELGRVLVPGGVTDLVATRDGAWVSSWRTGTVSRIDARTMTISRTIRVGDTPSRMDARGRWLWVVDTRGDALFRIDLRDEQVVERFAVGPGPSHVAVGRNNTWVIAGRRLVTVEVARRGDGFEPPSGRPRRDQP